MTATPEFTPEFDRQTRLAAVPGKYAQPDPSRLALLPRATGPKDQRTRGRCDVCSGYHEHPSIHLDYEGHADITLDLLEVDPGWTWRPAAVDPDTGGPVIVYRQAGKGNGAHQVASMWGYLQVLGVERLGVGTCEADKDELEKELIGDLLRNVALRFGFATKLWSKADQAERRHAEVTEAAGAARQARAPRQQRQGSGPASGPQGGGGGTHTAAPVHVQALMDEWGKTAGAIVVDARKVDNAVKAVGDVSVETATVLAGIYRDKAAAKAEGS